MRGISVALHKFHGVLIWLIFACLVGQVKEGACHIECEVVIIEGSRVDDCGEDDGVFSVRKIIGVYQEGLIIPIQSPDHVTEMSVCLLRLAQPYLSLPTKLATIVVL